MNLFSRLLLAFSALLLAVGACLHTSAFNKISAAIASSDLMPFAGKSLKILWLQDSVLSVVLAVVFAVLAIRPSGATRSIVLLLALIPTATAGLIYYFIGSFIGGHVFLAAAVAAILGGLQYPGNQAHNR